MDGGRRRRLASRRVSSTVWSISSVATLGSPYTFAGQALSALCGAIDVEPEVQYRETMPDVWASLDNGEVEAILLTAESTQAGLTEVALRLLEDKELSVGAEVVLPYHCALLGRPGTRLAHVRRVTGHGSLVQCRTYLSEELPGVPVEVHRGNSVSAGHEVLESDGSLVVVGTSALGEHLGLEVLAEDVDRGAEGAWWVIGRQPASGRGDTIIAECAIYPAFAGPRSKDAIPSGWRLRSIASVPGGDELWSYKVLTVWTGSPASDEWMDTAPAVRGRFDSVHLT